ncbi:MAG TPA: NADH:flavin oxidoreductase [Pirellulales bacterium]|jgi:2,4-dienoyl-CoA reductase-like NADH-dependent reductase (Old Yellow Enzyme family)|nr:NADH:flavin oxidoreductase [Pirellulales bacterium]
MPSYPKIAQLKTVEALRRRLSELGLALPVDEQILTAAAGSPLAETLEIGPYTVGNRWCIHPMEGWDAQDDGSPSAATLRRWRHFGQSGAKLIWGGEAAAVQPDGRANPRQTLATLANAAGLKLLCDTARTAHRERFGTTDDLLLGLQLTHSGRFSRPTDERLAPRIAYHHPLLDEKFHLDPRDPSIVWSDAELEGLIERYVEAAGLAEDAGFQFVDIKACHGYLLHEFLSARTRPGKFGGDLTGRARVLTTIIERIRERYPRLLIGVRLSVFDSVPFQTSRAVGAPLAYQAWLPYPFGFGVDGNDPLNYDLTEPIELLLRLRGLGVAMINVSAGSPYYNPHLQRPAIFPPSDGYLPPEDPLVGVARQIVAARICKEQAPGMIYVGSGYSYLQDFLPQVAQGVVRDRWIDLVGVGRMVLSYPELPADTLERGLLRRRQICRTFSDCTTAPRHGLISGCYPLDPYYQDSTAGAQMKQIKQQIKE